jgi:sulfite exporter TauE/SafE/copper chaperone CopZ
MGHRRQEISARQRPRKPNAAGRADQKGILRTTVPIRGMTCKACERRINRALRSAVPGIKALSASAAKGEAVISHFGRLDMAAVTAAVKKAGYAVGKADRRWLTSDPLVWRDVVVTVLAISAFIALGSLTGATAWFQGLDIDVSSGNLLLIALLGVAASVSTCMALVGGLVLSISARFTAQHPGTSTMSRLRPQVLFNVGRIVGFTLLGAATGAIGTVFTLRGPALALVMVAVAFVMGFLGVKLTGVSPRLEGASITLPGSLSKWLSVKPDGRYRDRDPLLFGAASFFLPCGFTQAVQVYALSTGNPVQAGLVMGLFAVGTTPGLLGVGALTSFIKGPRAPRILRVVGVLVVGFAWINLTGALHTLAISLPTGQESSTVSQLPTTGPVADAQVLRTEVAGRGYSPADAKVAAGRPIRWIIDVKSLGCGSALNAASLGAGDIIWLEQGENQINLPALEPGTYEYSCAMGMYRAAITAQ